MLKLELLRLHLSKRQASMSTYTEKQIHVSNLDPQDEEQEQVKSIHARVPNWYLTNPGQH